MSVSFFLVPIAALPMLVGSVLADQTFNGDVVIQTGESLNVVGTHTYTGSLTVEPGAELVMNSNAAIRIAAGGTLNVAGTEAQPVLVRGVSTGVKHDGFVLESGSIGVVDHMQFTEIKHEAFQVKGAELWLSHTSMTQTSGSAIAGAFAVIPVTAGGSLTMDACVIDSFTSGAAGSSFGLISATDANLVSITNTVFKGCYPATPYTAQRGEDGESGDRGDHGGLIDDNGHDGEDGKSPTGAPGGRFGSSFYAISLTRVDEAVIAQNVFHRMGAGAGAIGGRGGRGGRGGDGGNGVSGVLWDGGNGGDAGDGGRGGKGGNGGRGGSGDIIRITDPGSTHDVINNTFSLIYAARGGWAGGGGEGGYPGFGGDGGNAGTWGDPGVDGDDGSTGPTGYIGSQGSHGDVEILMASGLPPQGITARFLNNLITFTGDGTRYGVRATNNAVVDADFNAEVGADRWSEGSVIGSRNPGLVELTDPDAGDYSPAPTATAVIDAGMNNALPSWIETDLVGNPRFADDPDAPNTGLADGRYVIDLGAVESGGETLDCPTDLNADGIVDNGDIGLFVSLFLAGDIATDFNADGVLDNGDIGAFVAAYLAGC